MTDFTTRVEGGKLLATLNNAEALGLDVDKWAGGYILLIALTNEQAIDIIEAGWSVNCFKPGTRIGDHILREHTLYMNAKFPPAGYPLPGESLLNFAPERQFKLTLYGRDWQMGDRSGIRSWIRQVEMADGNAG